MEKQIVLRIVLEIGDEKFSKGVSFHTNEDFILDFKKSYKVLGEKAFYQFLLIAQGKDKDQAHIEAKKVFNG